VYLFCLKIKRGFSGLSIKLVNQKAIARNPFSISEWKTIIQPVISTYSQQNTMSTNELCYTQAMSRVSASENIWIFHEGSTKEKRRTK